ncbi:MAG: fucP [Propionibacteriaceae bacterium]|jgi:FHS family L-fucose permease-like MFS transporter|nr:fucP [Propionibacteriaceae bacterium]
MSTTPDAVRADDELKNGKARLVYPALTLPFILLVACFAAWGSAANLSDVLVGVFKKIFTMSNFESALVQFAYYGAYFTLAIPAAFINKRFGYKTGVLTGLGLAAIGGLMFLPASQLLTYNMFLLALFILAAGLSILETSANPFAIAMGPEETATRRLNLAQSFNPVGANIGVLLGAALILPRLTKEEAKQGMTPEQLVASQERDLGLVLGPYLGIAAVLVIIWVLIFFTKMHNPLEDHEHEVGGAHPHAQKGVFGRLFRNPHYRWGVVAQFFNVGAQVCAWSFTIQYAEFVVGYSPFVAGLWLQASLLLFLLARFLMFYLLGKFRPTKLLFAMGALGVVLCLIAVVSQNIVGLIAVVGISFSLSLMFPTIYGVALQGLGDDTKFGAAGLVMAILGGALLPPLQGRIVDAAGDNQAIGFIVPAIALAFVTAYALFDLRTNRHGSQLVSEAAH